LIAISVMCALIAGAAFAETTVGGAIFVGGKLLNGTNEKGSHPQTTAIGLDDYNTIVKITFGDQTAGGWVGLHNIDSGAVSYHGFAWWRPIPQLKLQLGRNNDGDFGNSEISGWGFTGEHKNAGGLGAMPEYGDWQEGRNHSRDTGWYGGIGGTWALEASIFAIENLTINLGVPLEGGLAASVFSKIQLNLQYNIIDIGKVTLSFQSNTGYIEGDEDKWYGAAGITDPDQSPKLWASFFLSAIENMGVELGLAYKFPFNNKATDTVTNHPVEIGLGFRFATGDFGVKLRAGFSLAASEVVAGGDPVKKPTQISVNIMPSYKIGAATVYLYTGLGIQAVEDWEDPKAGSIFKNSASNAVVGWFVNPYLRIPAGGLSFFVGFQLWSDGVKYPYYQNGELKYDPAKISWAIPIGFYTYF